VDKDTAAGRHVRKSVFEHAQSNVCSVHNFKSGEPSVRVRGELDSQICTGR